MSEPTLVNRLDALLGDVKSLVDMEYEQSETTALQAATIEMLKKRLKGHEREQSEIACILECPDAIEGEPITMPSNLANIIRRLVDRTRIDDKDNRIKKLEAEKDHNRELIQWYEKRCAWYREQL